MPSARAAASRVMSSCVGPRPPVVTTSECTAGESAQGRRQLLDVVADADRLGDAEPAALQVASDLGGVGVDTQTLGQLGADRDDRR